MVQSVTGAMRWLFIGHTDVRLRATWRILLSFGVFLGSLFLVSVLLQDIPFPEVLVNAGQSLALFIAIGLFLLIGTRVIDRRSVANYGFKLDRLWWRDLFGAILIGFLYQGLITVLMLAFGTGRIIGTFSPGIGTSAWSVALAFAATVFALLGVGIWEELLFRSVFIQNALEGLSAHGYNGRNVVSFVVIVSALVFGIPHVTSVAEGASVFFAAFQAIVAGLYFALAFVLTDSLAFPIGLHFSTNLWVASVFGQPGSDFPALVQMERNLQMGVDGVITVLVAATVLVGLIVGWVYATRGTVSIDDSLFANPRQIGSATGGD